MIKLEAALVRVNSNLSQSKLMIEHLLIAIKKSVIYLYHLDYKLMQTSLNLIF